MGVFLALASSAMWGTSDFGGGLLAKRAYAVRVVFWSQVGGLLLMCGAMLVAIATGHTPAAGGWLIYGPIAGLAGCLGLCSFYAALSLGTMGVVSPIAALGAIVPVLLGVISGERIGLLTGAGLTLALAGAALASGPELSGAVGRLPIVLAVVAAFSFGTTLYLVHLASDSSVVGGLWAMRTASVSALGLAWLLWPGGIPGPALTRRLIPITMLVGTGDLTANALFAVASNSGAIAVVSVLGSLYPVMTLLLARGFLHERLRPIQLVGVACAVAGVALAVT